MDTPNITPVQTVAVAGAIAAELLSDALIDGQEAKLITGLAGIIIPFVWIVADAIIRHGRAKIAAAEVQAKNNLELQPKSR